MPTHLGTSLVEPMCTTQKSYEDEGVQLLRNKVFRSPSRVERPTKLTISSFVVLIIRWEFAEALSLPATPDAHYCSSTGVQVMFW